MGLYKAVELQPNRPAGASIVADTKHIAGKMYTDMNSSPLSLSSPRMDSRASISMACSSL